MRHWFWVFLVLVACAEKQDNSIVHKPDSFVNEDESLILVNKRTGDTITDDRFYPLDTFDYIALGSRYMRELAPIRYTEKENFLNNEAPVKLERIFPCSFDSLVGTDREHLDTLKPPKTFFNKGKSQPLTHPRMLKINPWSNMDAAQYDIQFIKTNHGLPSNDIQCIYQSADNFIWFGTDKGLCRFDGTHLKIYTTENGLPENNVKCITQDHAGNLWIGTDKKGIVKITKNEVITYSIDSIIRNIPVLNIAVDANDEVWFLPMFGGAAYFKNDTIYSYGIEQGMYQNRPINKVIISPENEKYFVANGWGLYKLIDNRMGKIYSSHGYVPTGLIDSKGRFWLGVWQNLLVYQENDTIKHIRLSQEHDYTLFNQIREDSKGRIWASNLTAGLFLIDGDKTFRFGDTEGISSTYISDFIIDNDDNIWIATTDGGLNFFNPESFFIRNKYNGFANEYVNGSIRLNDSTEFLATHIGLVRFQNNKLDYPLAYSSSSRDFYRRLNECHDILVKNDTLWVTLINAGIQMLTPNGQCFMGGGMSGGPTNPMGMTLDQNGQIWIGSASSGLYRIIGDSVLRYHYYDGMALGSMTSLYCDAENAVWIGTTNKGIGRIKNDSIQYLNTHSGLPTNSINQITGDLQNRVWFLSDQGAYIYENNRFDLMESCQYNWLNDQVYSMVQDSLKRYWFCTSNGLIALTPKDNSVISNSWNCMDYIPTYFHRNVHFKNVSFLPRSLRIDGENLLIGTTSGLIYLNIFESNLNATLPTLFIDNILINDSLSLMQPNKFEGIEYSWSGEYPQQLELSSNYGDISFDFSALHWSNPTGVNFVYRLFGYEEQWTSTSEMMTAVYKNLDYGEYTFEIYAENEIGEKTKKQTFSFRILPPWYHTWWARIFFILLFLLLVYLVINWRTKQLQIRQKELEKEVYTATEEIREQKEKIEEAHREITDSIAYAKRIQSAILPPQKLIKKYIENSFILYLPKDIVAGDFYWMETSLTDNVLFAAADCTGHGVPGAMVSVVCNHALNRAVREFNLNQPAKILDKARELVLEEFNKSEEEVKDGMDIALCALKGTRLEYAGAHNPLWIIRKKSENNQLLSSNTENLQCKEFGDYLLFEIKADKQPIGKFHEEKPFTNHALNLQEGDTIYIFSDGFADQFGGDRGKKYKASNFKELLASIQEKELSEQRAIIERNFQDWKGSLEQLDDVCVIGVRI